MAAMHVRCRSFTLDWASIEAEYREGRYSLREMARRHACSHSSIANRAAREGWVRSGQRCNPGAAQAPTMDEPHTHMRQGQLQTVR